MSASRLRAVISESASTQEAWLNGSTSDNPLGGTKLRNSYEIIGGELVKYERRAQKYQSGIFSALKQFREGVSFVSVEVLESYLEDLLDLEVDEARLFIQSERLSVGPVVMAVAGLLGALTIGLYAAASGASLPLSFGISVCVALPFAVLWHIAPRGKVARRIRFAQVVSYEVNRRRGGDKNMTDKKRPLFSFEPMFSPAAQGLARTRNPA